MAYLTDIEIAQQCKMKPITEIAKKAGIGAEYLEQYGNYKAKIDLSLLKDSDRKNGHLILVTAITPTPAGEGKTTTTVGIGQAMAKIGKNAKLECVILDKNVIVTEGAELKGTREHPVIIKKGETV